MSKIFKLLILPGDGIGPEVMTEVTKLISAVEKSSGAKFEITYDGDGDATGVIIKDTVSAEWNVTHINDTDISTPSNVSNMTSNKTLNDIPTNLFLDSISKRK